MARFDRLTVLNTIIEGDWYRFSIAVTWRHLKGWQGL